MPHEYLRRQNPTLSEIEQLLKSQSLGGLGLSMPWKRDLLPKIDTLSVHARAIGAINTILPIRIPKNGLSGTAGSPKPPEFKISDQHCRAGPVLALYGDQARLLYAISRIDTISLQNRYRIVESILVSIQPRLGGFPSTKPLLV